MRDARALEFAVSTDAGRLRPNNEDAVLADAATGLVMVADGMGRYHAGEIASGMAIELVQEFVRRDVEPARRKPRFAPGGSTRASVLLRDALLQANRTIYDRAKSQALYDGMGTTVVAALFYAERVAIAHLGDARAYRLRHGVFEQLTRDHVRQYAAGGPDPGPRGRVTRALGVEPSVLVDLLDGPLGSDDVYLFCSDGLHAMVPEPDIRLTLDIFGDNLKTAAKQLIKLANDNGGRDNISVVIARPDTASGQSRRGWFGRISGRFS